MKESAAFFAESDAAAIERTLAGDRDAYRILVERHSRNLHRLAYRMTGNRHDSEDIVQEAFLRAYQKLGQYSSKSSFGTWVYRIAANCAIDRLERRKSEDAYREARRMHRKSGIERDQESLVKDEAPSPIRLVQSEEWAVEIQRALKTLTPAEQVAFVMRHWEGCGIEEISSVLKSSTNATKNTIFRAVQKLRHSLGPLVCSGAEVERLGTDR